MDLIAEWASTFSTYTGLEPWAFSVFLVVFGLQMSLGLVLVAGRGQLGQIVRQPVLWATVLAVFMVWRGLALPDWLANTTDLLAGLTIPLMLVTLYSTPSSKRAALPNARA